MRVNFDLYLFNEHNEEIFEGTFTTLNELQNYVMEFGITNYSYIGVPADEWSVFDLASHEVVFRSPERAKALEYAATYSKSHNPCSLLRA